MMAVAVKFRGYPHSVKGQRYPGPDRGGYIRPLRDVNDDQGWEIGDTVTFDTLLAEHAGGTTANDGADFAEFIVGTANVPYMDLPEDERPWQIVKAQKTKDTDKPGTGEGAK